MLNQLEILAQVIRIVTFTQDTGPQRKHRLYVRDDTPYRPEIEDRVRRYYQHGSTR